MSGIEFLMDNYMILPGTVGTDVRTAEEIVRLDTAREERPYQNSVLGDRPTIDETEAAWEIMANKSFW